MRPKNLALGVHKLPRLGLCPIAHELAIIVVRYKTNLLAVRLISHRQPALRRKPPYIPLGELPHRQQQPPQLLLPQGEQHIRLILAAVRALQQPCPIALAPYPRVMPRSDIIGVHKQRPPQQKVKLDLVIASQAGMRRPPVVILPHEIINHMPLKLALKVHEIMPRPDSVAHSPSVLHILHRAAPLAQRRGIRPLRRPQPHRHPHDLIPLPPQQQGSHRRIHPPAHSHNNALTSHTKSLPYPKPPFNEYPLLVTQAR